MHAATFEFETVENKAQTIDIKLNFVADCQIKSLQLPWVVSDTNAMTG